MTACFVAEFSCCVPRCCNTVMDILLSVFILYPKQRCTLCEWLQDILLLKWTKHQQSVYDKMPMVYRFSNGVQVLKCRLTFQLEGLKKYDKEAAYHRTHK